MSTRDAYKLGKSYKTASEAFKDADYATGLWRCESEWDRTKAYLIPLLAFIVAGVIIYLLCTGVTIWLTAN
jgi:hypothetical protein